MQRFRILLDILVSPSEPVCDWCEEPLTKQHEIDCGICDVCNDHKPIEDNNDEL